MPAEPGFLVRPARQSDAEDIALVHVRTWQHAYADIFPPENLAELSETLAARADHWREHIAVPETLPVLFVAEVPGEGAVGFSGAGQQTDPVYAYDGELFVLYVLPEYQRRGIGRGLFMAAASALCRDGYQSLLLWALAQNRSARTFYEGMGGIVVGERPYFRWGGSYSLIGYVWKDLGQLVGE